MRTWISRLTVLLLVMTMTSAQAATFDPGSAQEALDAALKLTQVCAFDSEYGDAHNMLRWEAPLRVYIGGSPTREDRQTVNDLILQLACRVPTMPNVTLVDSMAEANVTIFFVPLAEMENHVAGYVKGNWGFFYYWYSNWRIIKMQIAIATDVTDQRARNHLILEEFVGGLGLGNDHDEYEDSIVYQPWTTVQQLSEVDWLMLNMIYHPDVTPGMSWAQFYEKTNQRINDR